MAITKGGILGKSNPGATTDTVLYTVPSSKRAIAQINAANRSATEGRVRIAHALAGASVNWNTDALIYDGLITRDSPINFTGIALATDEDIIVRADVATIAFTITRLEFDDGV